MIKRIKVKGKPEIRRENIFPSYEEMSISLLSLKSQSNQQHMQIHKCSTIPGRHVRTIHFIANAWQFTLI
jgi:hypothetical protein